MRPIDDLWEMGLIPLPTIPSMKRRAIWHDYGAPGFYMITLVTNDRRPMFGHLQLSPEPYICLSPFGEAVLNSEIPKMSQYYPNVIVHKACMMPDHIHLLIEVVSDFAPKQHLGLVIKGFKTGCNKLCRASFENWSGGLFEKGYNDRILIKDDMYSTMSHYLDDNPRRLALKRINPDLFTSLCDFAIGDDNCQIFGNRFLLDIPDKEVVIVHRSDTMDIYNANKERWLACGERGGVIVSAAISIPEKNVLREAMGRGYKIIKLVEKGFRPLYKPPGVFFDACAMGNLLLVSPWPPTTRDVKITREQCLHLNDLATLIATR